MEVEVELEISNAKKLLQELEKAKAGTTNEMDLNIIMDEIVSLESRIQNLEELRNNMLQWNEYMSQCEHEFVLDLVDIDPDRSTVIKYCKHCLYNKDD